MASNKMIKVTENGGGVITLYARDKYGCEYAHTGYEIAPENLLRDIYAILIDDYTVSDWDNNELTNPSLIRMVRERDRERGAEDDDEDVGDIDDKPLTLDEYMDYCDGETTIAYGADGKLTLYYERMRAAGLVAFFGDAACEEA